MKIMIVEKNVLVTIFEEERNERDKNQPKENKEGWS